MRGAIAVVAGTAGAVIAALIAVLSPSGFHATGGNVLPPQAYVAEVGPGERLCQRDEWLPAATGSLELNVGTSGRPGPPLAVTLDGATPGERAGGYRDGWVRVPLSGDDVGRAEPRLVEQVCVRNEGDASLSLAGKASLPETAALVGGERSQGRIALRYRAAEASTWWADAGEVASRVARGKADLGPWTPAVLLLLIAAGAFALVLRSARP